MTARHEWRVWRRRVVARLGSLPMAVSLLIAIGITLAWGTMYEARFGTPAASRAIYTSWWFQALLGFLALNVAIAALRRLPWRRRHTPFLLAHAGLILLLLGGVVSIHSAIEGQLVLPEGQATRTLELEQKLLIVEDAASGWRRQATVSFDTRAWIREPRQTVFQSLPGRPEVTLTVDHYYPDAVIEETIEEGGAADHPAIRVRIRHGEREDAAWLLARDPNRLAIGWGHLQVMFLEPSSPEQLAAIHRSPVLPMNSIAVLRLPSGELGAVVVDASGARRVMDRLEVGAPVAHPSLGYELVVERALSRAVLSQRVTNRSDEVRQEAVQITAREGPQALTAWLGLPGSVPFALGQRPLTVRYEPATQELPFTIKLLDFRRLMYPGTQMPSGFESDVELSDPARGLILMRTIRMNQPLRYRGFSVFQSSFTQGPTETSVFSVRRDPGTLPVYLGFLTVISGIVCLFLRKRAGKRTMLPQDRAGLFHAEARSAASPPLN